MVAALLHLEPSEASLQSDFYPIFKLRGNEKHFVISFCVIINTRGCFTFCIVKFGVFVLARFLFVFFFFFFVFSIFKSYVSIFFLSLLSFFYSFIQFYGNEKC